MDYDYNSTSKIIKCIVDPNRLKIIDLLSCGEKCACELLEYFSFSQPTLSHHMKVLSDNNLIFIRKEGIWCYYSLNEDCVQMLIKSITTILTNNKDECICNTLKKVKC